MQNLLTKSHSGLTANVVKNVKLADDVHQITLHCREIAQKATPGQFISILCEDLILRRPFSVAYTDGNFFQIICKIKGKGTEYIAELMPNEEINIIGPLGKGFNIMNGSCLLVSGGVGIAPLLFLSKILEERGISYNLLAGFKGMQEIENLPPNSYIVTEDGSSKFYGKVNDYLKKVIIKHNPQKIYTCGPVPVMKYVIKTAEKLNIAVEAALERDFACGIGACMGCSIKVKENNIIKNRRICKDGPVFEGSSIIW